MGQLTLLTFKNGCFSKEGETLLIPYVPKIEVWYTPWDTRWNTHRGITGITGKGSNIQYQFTTDPDYNHNELRTTLYFSGNCIKEFKIFERFLENFHVEKEYRGKSHLNYKYAKTSEIRSKNEYFNLTIEPDICQYDNDPDISRSMKMISGTHEYTNITNCAVDEIDGPELIHDFCNYNEYKQFKVKLIGSL